MQYQLEILRNRMSYEINILIQKYSDKEMLADSDILKQAYKVIGRSLIEKTDNKDSYFNYDE